jgi:hypothetical protein
MFRGLLSNYCVFSVSHMKQKTLIEIPPYYIDTLRLSTFSQTYYYGKYQLTVRVFNTPLEKVSNDET